MMQSVKIKAVLVNRECWNAVELGFDVENWAEREQRRNQRALSALLLCVKDVYFKDIAELETACEALMRLEAIHLEFGF